MLLDILGGRVRKCYLIDRVYWGGNVLGGWVSRGVRVSEVQYLG